MTVRVDELAFMGIPVWTSPHVPKGAWILVEDDQVVAFGEHINQSVKIEIYEKALKEITTLSPDSALSYDQPSQVAEEALKKAAELE